MNNRNFIKFLYYILFVFTFVYIVIIFIDYLFQLKNLKHKKSSWQETIFSGKIVRKDIFPSKAEYILKTDVENILLIDDPQYDDFLELNLGDYVTLKTISRNLTSKNAYDMYIYNAYNVDKKAYIKEIKSVVPAKTSTVKIINRIIKKIYSLREKLILRVNHDIAFPYNGIILRLSLGYKETELRDVIEYFQDAGVMHVLVVSGLHVGFIYLMIYFLLKFVIIFNRPTKILISMLGVIFYMLLTGCSPPVFRATIIFLCFCISLLFNREYSQYHALTFAAIVLLFVNERNLFNPSFQLSFFACFGIIYFYPFVYEFIKEKIRNLSQVNIYILKLFIVTVSAQIFTLPLILVYFNKFSLISFVSNIFVIPLSSVLLWLSMGYYFFIENTFLSFYLSRLIEFVAVIYVEIIQFFAKIPYSSVKIGLPKGLEIFFYYLFVILLPIMLKKKKYVIIAIFLILFSVSSVFVKKYDEYKFKITFFNVGLGNATLLQTSDGKNILVDAGGNYNYDVGRYKLYPYMLKNRIYTLDYAIISHPHFPHYLGLNYLTKKIKVQNCIINNYTSKDVEYKNILFDLNRQGCNINILHREKVINFLDEGKIFLYPSYRKYDSDETSLCDANSILVAIKYKNFFCLLTNDIPNYELNNLINKHFSGVKQTIFLVSKKEHFNNIKSKLVVVSNGFKVPKDIKKMPMFLLDETDIEVVYYNNDNISKIQNKKDKIKILLQK
ncbi:MAG: ComEC/Rec2 family competence protein [Endomicrobiia bacterium]